MENEKDHLGARGTALKRKRVRSQTNLGRILPLCCLLHGIYLQQQRGADGTRQRGRSPNGATVTTCACPSLFTHPE